MGEHNALDEVRADAIYRAVRTFIQGVAVVALAAALTTLTAVVSSGVELTPAYAKAAGLAVLQAVLAAVASYVHRRYGAPPEV